MKKILLATSALVASTGFAAADLAISGSANMGFEYAEDVANTGNDEATPFSEVFVTFAGSGETDNGLSFGATTVYTVNNNGNPANDDTWVWVSGAWGKLSMGAVAEADQVAGLSDLGLDGIGTDDVAEALSGDDLTGQAHDVNYTGTFGGLTIGVSANVGAATGSVAAVGASCVVTQTGADGGAAPCLADETYVAGSAGTPAYDNQSYAIGLKYDFGDFYAGVGYADHSGVAPNKGAVPDHSSTSVFAGGDFGPMSVAAMWTQADPASGDIEAYGATAAYTMGATTITVAYSDSDLVTDAAYGVGLAYDLGGGATLKGAVGSVNNANVADLGISMSF